MVISKVRLWVRHVLMRFRGDRFFRWFCNLSYNRLKPVEKRETAGQFPVAETANLRFFRWLLYFWGPNNKFSWAFGCTMPATPFCVRTSTQELLLRTVKICQPLLSTRKFAVKLVMYRKKTWVNYMILRSDPSARVLFCSCCSCWYKLYMRCSRWWLCGTGLCGDQRVAWQMCCFLAALAAARLEVTVRWVRFIESHSWPPSYILVNILVTLTFDMITWQTQLKMTILSLSQSLLILVRFYLPL